MATQLRMADWQIRQRKLVRFAAVRSSVKDRIRSGWTLEQVPGQLRLDCARPRVCQETIYRHVYSREGMSEEGVVALTYPSNGPQAAP